MPLKYGTEYPTELTANGPTPVHDAAESAKIDELFKQGVRKTEVAKVTVPVLTIHGTRARNVAYGAGREWAAMLPNARLVTVTDAAHFPWVDDPELVFGSIKNLP